MRKGTSRESLTSSSLHCRLIIVSVVLSLHFSLLPFLCCSHLLFSLACEKDLVKDRPVSGHKRKTVSRRSLRSCGKNAPNRWNDPPVLLSSSKDSCEMKKVYFSFLPQTPFSFSLASLLLFTDTQLARKKAPGSSGWPSSLLTFTAFHVFLFLFLSNKEVFSSL